jgi:hypothetical protein
MNTWKMNQIKELFFHEFALPIGPFQGNDWDQQQPKGKKVMRRIFINYVTMIEMFAFSLFLHSFVQNAFTFIFTLCILITWIMEMHIHFNCHFVFLGTSSLCLNQIATSSPKFLMAWRFGAPLATMYTPKIEANWGLKHRAGGGWYLDMPKGTI